jgi:hypothetical protein
MVRMTVRFKNGKACIYWAKTKEHLPYTACARRYPSSAPATQCAVKAAAVYFAEHKRESSIRLCGLQARLSKK